MLLARGEPTWWGGVQAWFIMNEDLVFMLTILAILILILAPRRGRKRR